MNKLAQGDYKEHAIADFLSGADPRLIAKAALMDATIVTHERFIPQSRKKVTIPNVCQQFDVHHIDTFTLIRKVGASFELK